MTCGRATRQRSSLRCVTAEGGRFAGGAAAPLAMASCNGRRYASRSVAAALSVLFPALALATFVGVPLYAWSVRGRMYAIFGAVILAIALPGALLMHPRLVALMPSDFAPVVHGAFAYGMAAAGGHLMGLVQARLRSRVFRGAISIPGMAFIATGALSGVWLLALLPMRAAFALVGWTAPGAFLRWLDVVPFVVGVASVLTSLRTIEEFVSIPLDRAVHPTFTRLPVERRRRAPRRRGGGQPAAPHRADLGPAPRAVAAGATACSGASRVWSRTIPT